MPTPTTPIQSSDGAASPSWPEFGVLAAFVIAADGAARAAEPPDFAAAADEWAWVHLEREPGAVWLREKSGVRAYVADALLAEETRPRVSVMPEGTLLILRGVNHTPGAEPEDLISVRIWVEARRIISARIRPLLAVREIERQYAAGRGPATPADFVFALANGLVDGLAELIEDTEAVIDGLEEEVVTGHLAGIRSSLVSVRQSIIPLRRHLAPQRDALGQLTLARADWIDDRDRGHLREVADRVTRFVEDLDAARDRAAVVQDEVTNRLAEQMNRTVYVLSIVATLFLPVTFATGLLGMNVAGMPGTRTDWAFWAVCAALAGLLGVEIWILKRLGWTRYGRPIENHRRDGDQPLDSP